ncbi:Metallophosphoesterase MPPED2 [Dissostichus eleginoides]|uniref:Metallophosphoesterase MPPED2 n=1 Tax=Dissostichus eleginoides TaxID=100907 RepID=A0AAD9F7F4_DISEL|nr:Metallophosphoesterase MPPED2 [Dissostichus eleginoides]
MAHGKVTITVDEYSSNPTQAFTHYNINQSRFQPPHVHISLSTPDLLLEPGGTELMLKCTVVVVGGLICWSVFGPGGHVFAISSAFLPSALQPGGLVDPIPYDTPKPTGHTRFVCVSDTHSRTDGIQMPYGDVLLHTGDFTELGLPSEVKKFNDWLGGLPYEFKVVIAGNHELTFDKDFMAELVKQDYYRFPSVSKLKPEDFDDVQTLLSNCVYLHDSDVTIKGFRIYGAPW